MRYYMIANEMTAHCGSTIFFCSVPYAHNTIRNEFIIGDFSERLIFDELMSMNNTIWQTINVYTPNVLMKFDHNLVVHKMNCSQNKLTSHLQSCVDRWSYGVYHLDGLTALFNATIWIYNMFSTEFICIYVIDDLIYISIFRKENEVTDWCLQH